MISNAENDALMLPLSDAEIDPKCMKMVKQVEAESKLRGASTRNTCAKGKGKKVDMVKRNWAAT